MALSLVINNAAVPAPAPRLCLTMAPAALGELILQQVVNDTCVRELIKTALAQVAQYLVSEPADSRLTNSDERLVLEALGLELSFEPRGVRVVDADALMLFEELESYREAIHQLDCILL